MPKDELDFDAIEKVAAKQAKGEEVSNTDFDEYSMDDVDEEDYDDVAPQDLDDLEDVDEEEEEEEIEEEEEESEEDKEDVDDPYSKINDDIIKIAEDGTILKVKGNEYNINDLSKEEMVMYLQKGIRADQLMQEAAMTRRELDVQKQLVERGAQTVQSLLAQNQAQGQKTQGQQGEVAIPEALKPNELDTENEKALKQVAGDLYKQVNSMQSGMNESQIRGYEQQILSEVNSHRVENPVASIDEVLAVKSQFHDANIGELMEASNRYYSGVEFVKKALQANPETARIIREEIIKQYNIKQGKAKKVPMKKSRTSGGKKVSTKPTKKFDSNYNFDDARSLGMDFLKEVASMGDE